MGLNLPPIDGAAWTPSNTEVKDGEVQTGDNEDDYEFDISTLAQKPPYLYPDTATLKKLIQEGQTVFGAPAACLSWGIDGNMMLPQLKFGIEGEKQTASTLENMAKTNQGMFVFHSLSWPESDGDTDHIVVYGNLMIVIDSKRWKSARKYSVTASGTILRGTVAFDSGKVKVRYAIKHWQKLFPEMKVLGVVTIAQEKVFVTRDRNWYTAPYRLVENEKLAEFLLETFGKAKSKQVSGSTLLKLGTYCIKERNRMSEIIRVGGELRENDIPREGL